MDLKLLKRCYFFQNNLPEIDKTYRIKKDLGLAIALVKFEDFQTLFNASRYLFQIGMNDFPKVYSADGDTERAQKSYQFLYLKQAIQNYNACYDYILQIVYFGFDFYSPIQSKNDYKDNLKNCVWTNNSKEGINDRISEILKTTDTDLATKDFFTELRDFYKFKNNNDYPLSKWANNLKHKGAFTFEKEAPIKVRIYKDSTNETVFSNDYIEPEIISCDKIQESLIEHNNRIAEFIDYLYISLGLDDSKNSEKIFTYKKHTLDTTDLKIEYKE